MNYRHVTKVLPAVVLCVLVVSQALGANSISAAAAKSHVGENTTVCGQVVSTHFADTSRGKPTFLNLDEPYPKQIFTIVIWESDRTKFGNPESAYKWKAVCVSGMIESYRSVPQIVAREPGQITIKEK
jgi:hypothetical protein